MEYNVIFRTTRLSDADSDLQEVLDWVQGETDYLSLDRIYLSEGCIEGYPTIDR